MPLICNADLVLRWAAVMETDYRITDCFGVVLCYVQLARVDSVKRVFMPKCDVLICVLACYQGAFVALII